jgi:phage terminase small subunit
MGYENSGRRPSPRALKVLRGNPGRRRLPAELEAPPGAVRKPTGLSSAAAGIWDELAPVCLHMGTLTVADVRAFRTLCELQATLDQAAAWKDMDRGDAAITLEKHFAPIIRPYYALFGLEPVSRARLAPPKAELPVSKWAGALP